MFLQRLSYRQQARFSQPAWRSLPCCRILQRGESLSPRRHQKLDRAAGVSPRAENTPPVSNARPTSALETKTATRAESSASGATEAEGSGSWASGGAVEAELSD